MRQGTNPILLKIARFFSSYTTFVFNLIELFFKKKRRAISIIFLVATLRSGSTLTYQILNRGTHVTYFKFLELIVCFNFGGKKANDSYNNNDFKSDIGLVSVFQEN